MTNSIERAREKLYSAIQKLPSKGLRNDRHLVLQRMGPEDPALELSADPNHSPNREPVAEIAVLAPKISVYTGPAIEIGSGSGVIRAGDHIVNFPRTAAIEAFLNQRLIYPAQDVEPLYPEMELVIFSLDGIAHRPIRWRERALVLSVWIRRADGT